MDVRGKINSGAGFEIPPARFPLPRSDVPTQSKPGWVDVMWDVLVIGGGNAALTSAMSAHDGGARVLILERAPRHMRGGNSRHTRNIRAVHRKDEFNSGDYLYEEMWRDLCEVGEGPSNLELASFTVHQSETIIPWMSEHGAHWQQPLAGTLHLGRTARFFLGGGKNLLNSYYRRIDNSDGMTVVYDAKVEEFEFKEDQCSAVIVSSGAAKYRVRTKSVICASGGFEANLEWLRRYWGSAVDNYIIRGTPYNDGHILAKLYEAKAASSGQERGFHSVAVDARSPKFDGGLATRLDSIPFGIVVNQFGQRFQDEGEELWPKRYAVWGRHIAEQPDQLAVSLWDSKVNGEFLPPMFGVSSANSIDELAVALNLSPTALVETVRNFNDAVVDGKFDPAVLDDCHTQNLIPPKSHWAQRLDRPPFYGVAMRPGITFTYLGLAVAQDARVVREDGSCFRNVFAAGEIMSGNILSTGYLAGFGMAIGTVWGRQAGSEAAKYANE
jgi:tricarballylate dehydrogenase